MTHYTNTGNPIDFPKKKDIPMLEKFAAQSLIEHDGELIFSKEKFAELIVGECMWKIMVRKDEANDNQWNVDEAMSITLSDISEHFGVEE